MDRRRVSTGTRWERQNGYCRAVRVGAHVFVAGTLATDEQGDMVHPNSAYAQAVHIFQKIDAALREVDASLADVVRTRMYVTNIGLQDEVGRAHKDVMGEIEPAATMIAVGALASPEGLVEIEVDAVARG